MLHEVVTGKGEAREGGGSLSGAGLVCQEWEICLTCRRMAGLLACSPSERPYPRY